MRAFWPSDDLPVAQPAVSTQRWRNSSLTPTPGKCSPRFYHVLVLASNWEDVVGFLMSKPRSYKESSWWYCQMHVVDADGRKMIDAEPSPVWVPDSEAPTCMHCLKSEFTVINRRVKCWYFVQRWFWFSVYIMSPVCAVIGCDSALVFTMMYCHLCDCSFYLCGLLKKDFQLKIVVLLHKVQHYNGSLYLSLKRKSKTLV